MDKIYMAKIIAITNQKGGVGKTTTTVNLTAILADLGQRILVIDMDPQGNTTSGLGMEVAENSIYEVLTGHKTAAACIEETPWRNLSIIGSDIRLAGAEPELTGMERREYRLKMALAEAKEQFDFVFIDCPPSLGLLTLNALTAADTVLVPIQCEYYAL